VQEKEVRPGVRYLIGSAFAVGAVVLIAVKVDVGAALAMMKGVSPAVLAYASLIYLSAHVFRALRFGAALGREAPPFTCLLSIVSIHNFLNQVMPVRSGEGAYPVLARKVAGIGYSRGVSTLILVRAYDLAAFFSILVMALIYRSLAGAPHMLRPLALAAGVAAAAVMFRHVGYLSARAVRLGMLVLSHLGGRILPGGVWLTAAGRLASEFDSVEAGGNKAAVAVYSLMVWAATFLLFHLFVNAVGGGAGFVQSVIGSSGAVLTGLLPVNTVGSVGTLEGGWLLGFMFVGIARETALASGLLMHSFVILFGALLSAGGAVFLRLRYSVKSG
jgi:glycosyltransferase 2 family protein